MKSKKTIESFVGKIIYGFLLFMPLLAMLATCAYAIFNKNAYKSYANSQEIETNVYYDYNQLTINETYDLYLETTTRFNGTLKITGSINYYIDYNGIKTDMTGYTAINFFNNSEFYYTGQGMSAIYKSVSNTRAINITYSSYTQSSFTGLDNCFIQREVTSNNYIDNVFYYSIEKVENSQLFNWAEDTAIYNVVHEMTTTIQVNSSFVDLLLTYWFLITIIYMLFDIAFVMLMYVHDKIHGLLEK